MNKEEYLAARTSLAVKYFELCEQLKAQYASENKSNDVKKGDVITDGKNYICVEGFRFGEIDNEPEIIYYGEKVKKDGGKLKKSHSLEIFDRNVKNG